MGKLELVVFQTLAFLKFSSLVLFVHAVEKQLKFTQHLWNWENDYISLKR